MRTAHEACPDCGCNMYSAVTGDDDANLEDGLPADVECSKCGIVYVHVPCVYY